LTNQIGRGPILNALLRTTGKALYSLLKKKATRRVAKKLATKTAAVGLNYLSGKLANKIPTNTSTSKNTETFKKKSKAKVVTKKVKKNSKSTKKHKGFGKVSSLKTRTSPCKSNSHKQVKVRDIFS
jgi:hypothetical protein